MIKIEEVETYGWQAAIRGMRNPMNSWDKSDSYDEYYDSFVIGEEDLKLAKKLVKAGTDHRKFMRMITVTMDITAPLYWWKEFDTYKVGTVGNSCSTMHKIHEKEFTMQDFSTEHLAFSSKLIMSEIIHLLNFWRDIYINGDLVPNPSEEAPEGYQVLEIYEPKDKRAWWQMIQLLPSSYNQKRTIQLNYEVLANIYKSRKFHKLDEWRDFCDWIHTLPYSELITQKED